jgi:hypothetical protein
VQKSLPVPSAGGRAGHCRRTSRSASRLEALPSGAHANITPRQPAFRLGCGRCAPSSPSDAHRSRSSSRDAFVRHLSSRTTALYCLSVPDKTTYALTARALRLLDSPRLITLYKSSRSRIVRRLRFSFANRVGFFYSSLYSSDCVHHQLGVRHRTPQARLVYLFL